MGSDERGRFRQHKGWLAKLTTIISSIFCLYVILFLFRFFSTGRLFLYTGAFQILGLAFMLVLVFLLLPAQKGARRDRLPWYDVLLIIGSLVGTLYIFFNFDSIMTSHEPWASTGEVILGVMLILILCEATRRAGAWPVSIIAAIFFFHALFSDYFPGFLHGRGYSLGRLMAQVYVLPAGINGSVLNVILEVVFVYILFGAFLEASGAGKFFINLAFGLLGHVRGGPAKVAVVGSALFGTISGSAISNVVATGTFTIPMMKRLGYQPHFAGAVESVASTGGQIMPPVMGAVAFMIADFLGISYLQVCIAAALPAVLYFLAVFVMVDLEAAKLGLRGLPRRELPSFRKTFLEGWQFLIPIAVLLFFLMVLQYSAQTSCLYAIGALLVASWIKKETRFTPRKIIAGFESTARAMTSVAGVCTMAGVIIASVSLTGLGLKLSSDLVRISGGNTLLLLVLAAAGAYVLGMGLPTLPCYILLVVLVAPALQTAGVLPIAAHLFVFFWGMAALFTPPVCPVALVASSIAGASMMRTGYTAMRLGIILLTLPFMFAYEPALLMIGSVPNIVLAVITSIIGVIALGAGLQGYLLKRVGWIERVLLVLSATLLIWPSPISDIIGTCMLAGVVLWQWTHRRVIVHAGAPPA